MALGVASVLRSGVAPNPLPVDLWGHAPDDGAEFIRHLANECADAGIRIEQIRADPAYVHQLTRSKTESGLALRDITLTADPACRGRIELGVMPSLGIALSANPASQQLHLASSASISSVSN